QPSRPASPGSYGRRRHPRAELPTRPPAGRRSAGRGREGAAREIRLDRYASLSAAPPADAFFDTSAWMIPTYSTPPPWHLRLTPGVTCCRKREHSARWRRSVRWKPLLDVTHGVVRCPR